MQSNLAVTSYKPTFGIGTQQQFIDKALEICTEKGKVLNKEKFNKKVLEMASKRFGFNDYKIAYRAKKHYDGVKFVIKHVLYAYKSGSKPEDGVILTSKNMLRKVVEKYLRMTPYELSTKITGINLSKHKAPKQ